MGQSRKRIGRDGKARYTAYYDDVTGRRRSAGTFATKREAERAWQRAETKTAEGRLSDTARSRQLFARYVEEEWFPNHQIELTTRQNYRYVLDKHILPVFGGYKIAAILPADVRAWLMTMKGNGVKPATIKYCLSVLSAIFTTALTDQITAVHPCAGIKAPTVPPAPTRRIVAPEQYAAIHAALPSPDMQLLVETDIETGLRWGELVELRGRDLDLHHNQLFVSRTVIEIVAKFHPDGKRFLVKHYPKDREPRRVGLSTHISALLADHLAGKAADELLFTTPPKPAPTAQLHQSGPDEFGLTDPNGAGHQYRHGTLSGYSSGHCRCAHCRGAYASYRAQRRASGADRSRGHHGRVADDDPYISRTWFRQQIWEPALAHAGLDFHVRVHDLRHAHASWLLAGGADLQAVKTRMGHARLTTTEQYLHTLPAADAAAAIAALDTIRNRHT